MTYTNLPSCFFVAYKTEKNTSIEENHEKKYVYENNFNVDENTIIATA